MISVALISRRILRTPSSLRIWAPRFQVHMTLAHRLLEQLTTQAAGLELRHAELAAQLPGLRVRQRDVRESFRQAAAPQFRRNIRVGEGDLTIAPHVIDDRFLC